MKDYSQSEEQSAILKAIEEKGITAGRALDIGAWSPFDLSNVRALYELGWSLTCIEPSPGPMLGLLKEYGNDPRVTLIQAAVATEPGMMMMHISDDALSTSVEAEYEKWKVKGGFFGKMLLPVITIEDISTRLGGFDFVNIDAEGQSAAIFLHMLRVGILPPVVCCEHDSRTTELLMAATSHKYRSLLVNQTNVVMVR